MTNKNESMNFFERHDTILHVAEIVLFWVFFSVCLVRDYFYAKKPQRAM